MHCAANSRAAIANDLSEPKASSFFNAVESIEAAINKAKDEQLAGEFRTPGRQQSPEEDQSRDFRISLFKSFLQMHPTERATRFASTAVELNRQIGYTIAAAGFSEYERRRKPPMLSAASIGRQKFCRRDTDRRRAGCTGTRQCCCSDSMVAIHPRTWMNMMRFRSRSVVALVLLLAASSAIASVDTQTLKLEEIREQQGKLQMELRAKKGAFKEMSESERSALLAKQDRLLSLLQGKQAPEELNQDDRLEVFNILEQIKSAVAQAEDDRKVCSRVKPIGSNRPQVVCTTAKQAREHREKAQETLGGAPRMCNTPGCTGN